MDEQQGWILWSYLIPLMFLILQMIYILYILQL